MKKKVILYSILTIALCVALVVSSTFALFTNTSTVGVSLVAGNVEMTAEIAIAMLESVKPDENGLEIDEYGAKYSYTYIDNSAPYRFLNGGTAEVNGSVLTVKNITPGDRLTFVLSGENKSNVAIQYRYVIECISGEALMSDIVLKAGGEEFSSVSKYTSAWDALIIGQKITDKAPIIISLELPVGVHGEYETQTAEIKITVEAVQGDANTESSTASVEHFTVQSETSQ